VALLVETRGSGKNQTEVGVARCSLMGALPDSFSLEQETLGDKVMHLVGRHDHQLGYSELDAAFHLRGVDDAVRRVLSDTNAQNRLLVTHRAYPSMRIGNGSVQLETRPVPGSEEALNALLSDAISVAQALLKASRR
jgi:hypothetical protein